MGMKLRIPLPRSASSPSFPTLYYNFFPLSDLVITLHCNNEAGIDNLVKTADKYLMTGN